MAGAGGTAKRNIALLGHANCGKTMLAEALLFKAGVTTRMGSIREGTTVSDAEPEEKDRQASIDSSILHFEWKGVDINIVDTPGYPDFIGQVIPTLRAVDVGVVCVSAASGIEVNTRKVWELTEQEGIPRVIVVSKMDAENADFDTCVSDIQEAFGAQCKPFVVPKGDGNFAGVASVLAGEGGDKDGLMESIVETDEAMLERYLEGGEVSDDELSGAISNALSTGTLCPIFCIAAEKDLGLSELADFIAKFLPGPAERKLPLEEGADAPGSDVFTGQVFKSVTDPFVGKVSFFRVFTGTISAGESLVNLRTKTVSKVSQIFRVQGKEQEVVDKAIAGDIVCVAKVEDVQIGDTVTASEDGVTPFVPFVCPEPMVSLAVEPTKRGDEGKIGGSLDKLAQEDPTFKVLRDATTHEMVVSGMSSLHLDIMLERLNRRFDVQVDTKEPKIAYKETIMKGAQGHYKHKKQTGGRGQYGEVYLRIVPLQRGEGFQFKSEVVGGTIPTQYIPAIEKGIRESMVKGFMAGYPIEDVEVVVTDGSFHTVDSSEAAFKIAASRAFKDAFNGAKPCLLEPIVDMHVTAPVSYMGEITGDINGRRGRIIGIESHAGAQTINAQVPLGEIMRYSTELRSSTGGEGSYTIQFARYDVVPAQAAQALVKNRTQQEEED